MDTPTGTPPSGGTPHSEETPDGWMQETILEQAQRLVFGDREKAYDHPLDNFTRIAAGWSVIVGAPITPEMVGLMMVWTKIAREVHRPSRDNRVDMAGYAQTVDRVHTERLRRG